MVDRYGEIVNGTITVAALLLLLFIGNYNHNGITLPSTFNNVTNNTDSNDDNVSNININAVIPSDNNNNNDNTSELLLNDNNTSDNNNNNSSNNNNNNSNGADDTQVNGDAWLFTYPSIKYVALPVECIALTDIDEVAYVECIIIPPHGSNAYASITITNAHAPTYSPLPSDCNNNCKEFNAWFNGSNTPDRSGEWRARALFYSSSNELIAERETTFLVYNAGGGSGGGSERFMVMPESMLGVLSIGIASLASFAAYTLIRIRKRG
jgi:hypothetical protein